MKRIVNKFDLRIVSVVIAALTCGIVGGMLIGASLYTPQHHGFYKQPMVETIGTINDSELFWFLRESFGGEIRTRTPDETYSLVSLEDFTNFLQIDNTDEYAYIPERFDCDDFSYVLKGRAAESGICLGVVKINQWEEGQNHLINLFVTLDEEGKLEGYLIEPQTDDVWQLNESWQNRISFIQF